MTPQFENSWGMGDNRVRFKLMLPCLCKSRKGEFVNCKFLYPEETHKKNITVYECLHCRTVISLFVTYVDGELYVKSKTELGKNANKPMSKKLERETRNWYRTRVTRQVIKKLIDGLTPEEDPDDPSNWKTGWKI